jgi:hypothetical protein
VTIETTLQYLVRINREIGLLQANPENRGR